MSAIHVHSKPVLDLTNEVITYSWLPADSATLREHRYSAVFPRLTDAALERAVDRFEIERQYEPVVLANGEIIAGKDGLDVSIATGVPAYVLDLGEILPQEVRRYVTIINSMRHDISRKRKRRAAKRLVSVSLGSITRREAERICGLPGRE